MSLVIAYENPEDPTRVCVIYLTPNANIDKMLTFIDTTRPYLIMDYADLPHNYNDYFEAWVFSQEDGMLTVKPSIEKARNIYRQTLREARKPYLASLDVAYIRAQENGNTDEISSIVQEKNRLREITTHPSIEEAQTIDDLRNLKLI